MSSFPEDSAPVRETRWLKVYHDGEREFFVSKIADGEPAPTIQELRSVYLSWNEDEQYDFAQAFCLQSSFDESGLRIIRFLLDKSPMATLSCLLEAFEERPIPTELLVPCLFSARGATHVVLVGDALSSEERREAVIHSIKKELKLLLADDSLFTPEQDTSSGPAFSFVSGVHALLGLLSEDDPSKGEYQRLLQGFREHPNPLVCRFAGLEYSCPESRQLLSQLFGA